MTVLRRLFLALMPLVLVAACATPANTPLRVDRKSVV